MYCWLAPLNINDLFLGLSLCIFWCYRRPWRFCVH